MQGLSQARWRAFLAWLGSGVLGIQPLTLRLTLGPIAALLPLARQVAGEISPWLLAMLAERQRRGLGEATASPHDVASALAAESAQQPCRREALRHPRWLGWLLTAELLRLARLTEAPEAALRRQEWLAWEVCYWALAATRALETALTLAWHEALPDCEPVHSAERAVGIH